MMSSNRESSGLSNPFVQFKAQGLGHTGLPFPSKRKYPRDLPPESYIIQNIKMPRFVYYKIDNKGPVEYKQILGPCEAVVNYERKIVALFINDFEKKLYGLYYRKQGRRIKLTPACMYRGKQHFDYFDDAGRLEYAEFEEFAKPQEIILASIRDYNRLSHRISCPHHPELISYFPELPPESHIIGGVEFPEGFFFRVDGHDRKLSLVGHICDAVVDPSGKIVAVFLGPREFLLFAIYRDEDGPRVKLSKLGLHHAHFETITPEDARAKLYPEFREFQKPQNIYRKSLAECVYGDPARK